MISSFFTIPNVLTTTECQQIINYCSDKCKPSTLGEMSIEVDSVEDIRNSVNTFIFANHLIVMPVIWFITGLSKEAWVIFSYQLCHSCDLHSFLMD